MTKYQMIKELYKEGYLSKTQYIKGLYVVGMLTDEEATDAIIRHKFKKWKGGG